MKLDREKVPFTQIANEILYRKDLSLKAKGMYAYLFSKPDDWNFAGDRIVRECKEGRKVVFSALKELEDAKLLVRKKHPDGRMEYYIQYSSQMSQMGNRVSEPLALYGTLPKWHVGKRGSISNKEIDSNKDKESNIDFPEWLNKEVWKEWEEHRKEKGKKLTPRSVKLQIKLLEDNKKNHVEIILNSIRNGWTGLFPITEKSNGEVKLYKPDYARAHEKRIKDEEERSEREANATHNERVREIQTSSKLIADKFKIK